MATRITFAIPYYQGLDYLHATIESVREQAVQEWYLLVSDDGEDAGEARELVASFDDWRIAYHRNERNLGMVRNWNQCIDKASTDLVTLLHADDLLLPNYASVALDLDARHPDAAAFFFDARIIDQNGRSAFSTADAVKKLYIPSNGSDVVLQGSEALRVVMAGNFIMCPTLCLKKSVLGDRRFSREWKQVQDLEFTSRLLMDGDKIAGSRITTYAYRRHPENATAVQSESLLRFDEEFRLFERIAVRAEGLGWHDAARVSRRAAIVRMHLGYRILLDVLRIRPRAAIRKLRCLLQRGATDT